MPKYMLFGREIGNAPNVNGVHTGKTISKIKNILHNADILGNKYKAVDIDEIKNDVEGISQSLTNLKNPAKGTKGILVNGGSPLTRDFLLVYTLKTTKEANTGASISINGIKVCDLVTRTPNNIIEICGCVRAFKGDIITTHVASAGGYADVYAYC